MYIQTTKQPPAEQAGLAGFVVSALLTVVLSNRHSDLPWHIYLKDCACRAQKRYRNHGIARHAMLRNLSVGIKEILTTHRSPCQNPYFVAQTVDYYNKVRGQLSLYEDAPYRRPILSTGQARIVRLDKASELHHQCMRTAA